MAKIETPKSYDRRQSDPNAEYTVTITGTESKAEYRFTLKRKHIEVLQLNGTKSEKKHGKRVDADWEEALTVQEKAQVFAFILDHYRERSLGDRGFRGAAIGVMEKKIKDSNGVPQTRLFIGTNTMRWATAYFKDCAEQNMVNAATDTMAFEAVNRGEKPTEEKLKAIYIMQGITPDEKPMSCACGKCTDMLANTMKNAQAKVTTIPLLTPELRLALKDSTKHIELNHSDDITAIQPYPESDCLTVWETTVGLLNRNRAIQLKDPEIIKLQETAYSEAIKRAVGQYGLPENRAALAKRSLNEWHQKKIGKMKQPESTLDYLSLMLVTIKESAKLVTDKIQAIVDTVAAPAEKAAENIINFRRSEAELDCAFDQQTGQTDLGKLNQFLYMQINNALADRLLSANVDKMNKTQRKKFVADNIKFIRCVAIQMDDNSFHSAVQVDASRDNAMPNAEVVALENAVSLLGRHGVKNVWAMEFNPTAIEHGQLVTSPKEGVERLSKRATKVEGQEIHFHYIPFNTGGLDHEKIAAMTKSLSRRDIYPAGHLGYMPGQIELGERRKEAHKPQAMAIA